MNPEWRLCIGTIVFKNHFSPSGGAAIFGWCSSRETSQFNTNFDYDLNLQFLFRSVQFWYRSETERNIKMSSVIEAVKSSISFN